MLACTQRATLSCLELGETDRADVRLCHVVLVVAVAVVAAVPASRGTVVLLSYCLLLTLTPSPTFLPMRTTQRGSLCEDDVDFVLE